jgi:hypothetical protein
MRNYHRELLKYLKSRGLKPKLNATKGHMRITWMIGNRTCSIITSMSPSDRRAIRNARADIRRQISARSVT